VGDLPGWIGSTTRNPGELRPICLETNLPNLESKCAVWLVGWNGMEWDDPTFGVVWFTVKERWDDPTT
jgi:hypothetical protein